MESQRRANAASARPPRTPSAYGFAAPRSFSSFLRPLFSMVAHCVRLYPMPQPWMASATVGYGSVSGLQRSCLLSTYSSYPLEFLGDDNYLEYEKGDRRHSRDLYACRRINGCGTRQSLEAC